MFRTEDTLDSESMLGGLVVETGHPLFGLWVELSPRTRGSSPTYNLRAFQQKPGSGVEQSPCITGFAGLVQD